MRRLFTLLALSLVVAACTGSGEDTATTTTTDAADMPTTAGEAETTTTTSADAGTTTTSGEAAGGTDDCLVGTWVLDTDAFVQNFDAIFEDAGVPATDVTALDGTFTVELGADGSLTGTRDEWGFSIVTGEGTITMEINGSETGTWSADGSRLTVEIDESDLAANSSIEVDGQVLEMPEEQFPVPTPPGIASNSQYSCSGDVLNLTNAGVESVLNRA